MSPICHTSQCAAAGCTAISFRTSTAWRQTGVAVRESCVFYGGGHYEVTPLDQILFPPQPRVTPLQKKKNK